MGNSVGGLSFDTGEAIEYNGNDHWQLFEGSKKADDGDDKESIAIFKCLKSQTAKLPLAKQCWSKLRTIKHPFVLSFINGAEVEEGVVLITESVVPLEIWLKRQRSCGSSQDNVAEQIHWGFKCILEALQFIHSNCNLVHGYLGHHAIFVAKNGDWKIGALDIASNLTVNEDEVLFKTYENLLIPPYRGPERRSANWSAIKSFSSMDIYSLANVFQYALDTLGLSTPAPLESFFKKMTSAEPNRRPTCSQILKCSTFTSSNYIEIMSSLTELNIKTPQESIDLMTSLAESKTFLSLEAVSYKILPFLGRNLQIAANDFQSRDARETCRHITQSAVVLLDYLISIDKIESFGFLKHILSPLTQVYYHNICIYSS
jgi:SCY1-like protein 1